MGIVLAILAAVAVERLFFPGPLRRRSGFANLLAAGLAIALGSAAIRAWRNRQPYGW